MDTLVELCIQHVDLLESNLTAEVTKDTKNSKWQDITNAVNGVGQNSRDVSKVKKKWQDMKSKAVTKYNKQNEEATKTGGGRAKDIKINKCEQQIIDMLILKKSNLLHGLDGYDTGERMVSTADRTPTANILRATSPTTSSQRQPLEGNEADTSAPTGALALLLQNVGATSPVSTQMPVSEDEDAIFQDTTQNTPQQSVTQPLDVDHSNGGSTVDESQDSQEEDLTRRDTNRQQRFRLKSVADRKRKLDEVHLDYFSQAAKYHKAKSASLQEQDKLTKLQIEIATMEKKKRTEEMKLLGVDMDIKKLQKRKLQLEVVQQEAALQMQGVPVPHSGNDDAEKTSEESDASNGQLACKSPAAPSSSTENREVPCADMNTLTPVEQLIAAPALNTQVRFLHFTQENMSITDFIVNQGHTSYQEMPLPVGLHDYIPHCIQFQNGLFNHFARNVMNLETEMVLVRFHILEHYGHRLLPDKPARDIHLESITHFMLNLYLNKTNCPLDFWQPDLKKRKI